jgi:type IV secretion system protein VirB1
VNGGAKLQRQPVTVEEAVVTAQWLLANGYNIDLGLGQVNSSNLNRVGLSVTEAFDPCKNLKAAGTIFNNRFQAAMQQYPEGQALQVALSAYNTGNYVQGFRNGYVNKVLSNMPDKAQMQTAETSTGVQPIPLADAAHKPTIAEVIRPKPATAQPATVTVEKPIEEQAKKMSVIGGAPDKPAARIEPSINVYSEANHQGVMVYSQ